MRVELLNELKSTSSAYKKFSILLIDIIVSAMKAKYLGNIYIGYYNNIYIY